MRINHNIPALNAHRILNRNNTNAAGTMERLSSGRRINRAKDDAAGMAISEKMKTQIRGLRKASQNTLDGISLIQTAEGAMNEVHSMLQRMRELAVQSANGTMTDEDRTAIQAEVNQLTSEVNRIANGTEFNTRSLLRGNEGPDSNAVVHRMSTGASAMITGTSPMADLTDDLNAQTLRITIDGEERVVRMESLIIGADIDTQLEVINDAIRGLGTAVQRTSDGHLEIKSNSVGGGSFIKIESTPEVQAAFGFSAIDITERGTAERDLGNAKGSIYFSDMPEHGSTLTIGEEKIEFYDSDIEPYTGSNRPIDINGQDLSGIMTILQSMSFVGIKDDGEDSAVRIDPDLATRMIFEAKESGFRGQSIFIEGTPKEFIANLQIGPNQGQGFRLSVGDIRAVELGISSTRPDGNTGVRGAQFYRDRGVTDGLSEGLIEHAINVSNEDAATSAITVYNNAIVKVAQLRGELGAIQNRLEYTSANLDNTMENMTAALSRIEDTDMALEMSEFTKMNIMLQAGTAMLAQANQMPQMVLQLLQ